MRADMELGALHERAAAVLARLTEGGAGAVVKVREARQLVHELIRQLVEVMGEDRVLLGTDYPFPLGEVLIADTFPGKVIEQSHFSPDVKRKLFWDNAMEFLNLDPSLY